MTLIEVADVAASIAFYRKALGFDLVDSARQGEYTGWAWIRHGNVELMLNAMFGPDDLLRVIDSVGVHAHRDTTIFIGCPDLDGASAHLNEVEIAASPPTVTHHGMAQISFSDPDGYGICLEWPAA